MSASLLDGSPIDSVPAISQACRQNQCSQPAHLLVEDVGGVVEAGSDETVRQYWPIVWSDRGPEAMTGRLPVR